MILEDLMEYIENTNSPERVAAYKGLLPFLMQLDPSLMEINLSQFAGFIDSYDTMNNLDQFENFLLQVVKEGIEEFGVYLSDEVDYRNTLFTLGDALRGLYRIDQYEDMATLSNLLDEGSNAKETVVSILEVVSPGIDSHLLLNVIDEVSTSLIRRMKENFADMAYQFDQQVPSAEPLLVERVRLTLNFLNIDRAREYFTGGGVIGEPLDNYLDYYFSVIEEKRPEIYARYALLSAVAADLPKETLRGDVAAKMEFYFAGAELLAVTRQISTIPLPEFVYA